MRLRLTTDMIRDEAIDRVETLSGLNIPACYQCGRCSAGCPVIDEMDIIPSEVIRLLEGSIAPVECVKNPDICERSTSCDARDIWCSMKQAVDKLLESTTLQDLVERQKSKEPEEQMAYFI